MPFSLKNYPSTFQRVVDNILLGIQNKRSLVYMDDIIVYSPTIHEHIFRLTDVFKRLTKANLKIQPHVITQDGVKPKMPKEIKSFLGLVGFIHASFPILLKFLNL